MALCLVSVPTNVTNFSVRSGAKFLLQRLRFSPQRHVTRYFAIRAVQESEGPRRLVDIIRIIPDISRNYFRSRSRRALFGGISLLGGFYVAQTISLSFGALGVNDVIAAVVCVLLTEYVTRFYYSRPKRDNSVCSFNLEWYEWLESFILKQKDVQVFIIEKVTDPSWKQQMARTSTYYMTLSHIQNFQFDMFRLKVLGTIGWTSYMLYSAKASSFSSGDFQLLNFGRMNGASDSQPFEILHACLSGIFSKISATFLVLMNCAVNGHITNSFHVLMNY